MNVTIWGINFSPEPTGIAPFTTDMAEAAVKHGFKTRVITGFPYYPHWKKRPGDRFRFFSKEKHAGVDVTRCWQYVPQKTGALRRILHEASFGVTSFMRALWAPRSDLYIVISPPLILGVFGWMVAKLKRSEFVFHVQDLQPDAAVGLGMVSGGGFVALLYKIEKFIYERAAVVSGISQGMMRAFAKKGVPSERRLLFPNWTRDKEGASPNQQLAQMAVPSFRQQHGIGANDFLAVYSGNIGRKQGLGVLVEAAELLAREQAPGGKRVKIVIAGAGAGLAELKEKAAAAKLDNLIITPLLDDLSYASMLRTAQVGLITQVSGTGQYFFPSKLLTLLQAGLPLVTVADRDSELADAVESGGFAINVEPNQPRALADAMSSLCDSPERLAQMARDCRWVDRFRRDAVLPKFFAQMTELIERGNAPIGEERPLPQSMGAIDEQRAHAGR